MPWRRRCDGADEIGPLGLKRDDLVLDLARLDLGAQVDGPHVLALV